MFNGFASCGNFPKAALSEKKILFALRNKDYIFASRNKDRDLLIFDS